MKIICAPDSFKDAVSASQAAEAMAKGIQSAAGDAEIIRCPVADGGEGTVDALVGATGGTYHYSAVTGPLGESVKAKWGMLGKSSSAAEKQTAVIEMAAASGLELVPIEKRNPAKTTTYGTGELISEALQAGAQKIILGIGGSATNDGGCGAAQALGALFYDSSGNVIKDPITGGMLKEIARVDLSNMNSSLGACEIQVACDVTNPLAGPNGAACVYSLQKGADKTMIKQLDEGLKSLSSVVQECLGKDVKDLPGAGAAGGLGYGAVVFLGASLERGIDIILSAVDFERKLSGCDLCLTGEGKLDIQSLSGKTICGVAQVARKYDVPVVALVGKFTGNQNSLTEYGLKEVIEIGAGLPVAKSISRTAQLLEKAAGQIAIQYK